MFFYIKVCYRFQCEGMPTTTTASTTTWASTTTGSTTTTPMAPNPPIESQKVLVVVLPAVIFILAVMLWAVDIFFFKLLF